MPDEQFPLVAEDGTVVGVVSRAEAHGNPALLHPVVHCLVANQRGEVLLQLRSARKTI